MNIQLLRHATILVTIGGKTLLVDPMLSDKDAMPPIVNSNNDRRNPLVDIIAIDEYLALMDAVLLTHTHRDHFDDAAAQKLPKTKPILCQPEDEEKLIGLGFKNVIPVVKSLLWEGIRLIRTKGQHGTGAIGEKMGPVSGYVLEAEGEPSLYITGDTIYCDEVEFALANYHPDITVVNGGGAQFNVGDPITMTTEDVAQLLRFAPKTKVVVVHLEAINHCLVTRADFYEYLTRENLLGRVLIPQDGELIKF